MVDMRSDSAMTDAFDKLEDARDDVARYKRGWRYAVAGLVTSTFMVVAGAVIGSVGTTLDVDTGGITGALCGVGGVGIFVAVGFGVWWFHWNHTYMTDYSVYRQASPSPQQRLRAAERKYRDVTMDDA